MDTSVDAGVSTPRHSLGREVVLAIAIGIVIAGAVYMWAQTQDTTGTSQSIVLANNVGAQPRTGSPAPDFQVTMLDGTTLKLSDLRGKPVWLTFWATWCPPCRAEATDIDATYAQYKDKGLAYVAISIGEFPDTLKSFITSTGYTFPIGVDTTQAVASLYWINGIPTHFFIDRNGVVQGMQVGSLSRATAAAKLDKLLAQ